MIDMPTPQPGRRERNKQVKLERIIAAASELFAAHGVDEVTTGQIADAADVGAGTLFLYAKTKGELLLLVQNAHYRQSLERAWAEALAIRTTINPSKPLAPTSPEAPPSPARTKRRHHCWRASCG